MIFWHRLKSLGFSLSWLERGSSLTILNEKPNRSSWKVLALLVLLLSNNYLQLLTREFILATQIHFFSSLKLSSTYTITNVFSS